MIRRELHNTIQATCPKNNGPNLEKQLKDSSESDRIPRIMNVGGRARLRSPSYYPRPQSQYQQYPQYPVYDYTQYPASDDYYDYYYNDIQISFF